jgi:hypothetical protein
MSTTTGRQPVEGLLAGLEPYLNAETKKSAHALNGLFALFPGQSLPEIEKTVRSLLATARNSVPVLVDRTRALLAGSAGESIDAWAQDLGKLNVSALKQLGNALDLELTGAKAQLVADLRKWVESRGQARPTTAAERSRLAAAQFAGDLPDRIRRQMIDVQFAEEIHRKADAAAKELDKQGFEAFGKLLGIPVSGTKAAMLKQIKNFVDRAAVSHGQTKF